MPQSKRSHLPAPCKLAVTGGIWEYAHNHLCFYNYFRLLESRGLFTYVPLLDLTLDPERDLTGVDAVIISRGRHPNVLRALEHCRLRSIPTIYMIDDNWFSVGKDWPREYGHIFAPGMPAYEVFITCLRESDAVLLYNQVLEEDVARYARRIIRLPVNVSQNDFSAPLGNSRLAQPVEDLLQWRARTGGLIIGYVGSPRYTDAAFRAMASVARKRPGRARIVLFGTMAPEHSEMLEGIATSLPYVPYEEYAAAMGRMAPDVLVAPLEDCRTSRSKCPNKYLEYSVAGAAGVYSGIPPYSEVVRDGSNGLLVATEDESAWLSAILSLVDNAPLRKRLASAAREDVLSTYETAVVAPAFVDAVLSIVRDGTAGEQRIGFGGKA
jgi:glycosyltransferase involved in cell wall biosynthesis